MKKNSIFVYLYYLVYLFIPSDLKLSSIELTNVEEEVKKEFGDKPEYIKFQETFNKPIYQYLLVIMYPFLSKIVRNFVLKEPEKTDVNEEKLREMIKRNGGL